MAVFMSLCLLQLDSVRRTNYTSDQSDVRPGRQVRRESDVRPGRQVRRERYHRPASNVLPNETFAQVESVCYTATP